MHATIALTGLFVVLVLCSEATGRQWGRRAFKPLASIGFVLCALLAGLKGGELLPRRMESYRRIVGSLET